MYTASVQGLVMAQLAGPVKSKKRQTRTQSLLRGDCSDLTEIRRRFVDR